MSLRILIVDDEAHGANAAEKMAIKIADVKVIGKMTKPMEALNLVTSGKLKVDVILLDIGIGDHNNAYPFDQEFNGELEVIDDKAPFKDFYVIANCLKKEKLMERRGHHTYMDGRLEFEMRRNFRQVIMIKDILEIRRTNRFTYVSLADFTYVSRYPITRFDVFDFQPWMAHASKNNVVNLKKIKSDNIDDGNVILINGTFIIVEAEFRKEFWSKLISLRRNLEECRQLAPCAGFEVVQMHSYQVQS